MTIEPASINSVPQTTHQVIIQPSRGWFNLQLRAVWQYRELLYFLVWKDIKVRYKQTALGIAWVILQPLLATLIFTIVFGRMAKMPTDGLPYPIFAFAGLLPWNYFAGILNRSSTSLINNVSLITKVYFPRLAIPLSGVLVGLLDFSIACLVFGAMLFAYRIQLTWRLISLPLFLLMAMCAGLGVSLWLSALSVRYRDINQLLPFLVQVWMYATPVVFSTSLFPEQWRPLLALNPMTGVVEGFRWAITGSRVFTPALLGISIAIIVLFLVSGLTYFSATEKTFADII